MNRSRIPRSILDAQRGHFAVLFRVTTTGVQRGDVAAGTIGSTTEPYLNETIKCIPQ